MDKSFLVTRPKYDLITNYLFYWAKEIIQTAENRNIKVIDLKVERVNRKEVFSIINKLDPGLVFFNGHGSTKTISGQKDEVLIEKDDNEKMLKDKIIYSLSCSSASDLGKSCISKGTNAFIGYDGDFALVTDKNAEARPLKDAIAELFLRPSNKLIKSLLKEKTAQEAFDKSQEEFSKSINATISSDIPKGRESILSWLIWDKEIQTLLGDATAIFS